MTILLPVGISFALGLLLIPLVRRLSFHFGFVARPREDRWHKQPTPTLGGIGIFFAFALGLLINLLLIEKRADIQWGLLGAAGLMFGLGLVDDLRRLSPPAKLIGQILVAILAVSMGYTTNFFTPKIPNQVVAQIPNVLLTMVWLVGITNAINLLDNMDGLAGGISLITASFLSYFFWSSQNQSLLPIALSLAGALLSFLVFNFPPAKIFMGDSGSLFLGFTLAVMAIARQPQASNVLAVMGVPTLLFTLPILDTTLVTLTRLMRGQSPAQGGRDHTSHRLIAFGLSERQTLAALYGVAIIAGVVSITIEAMGYWLSLVLVPLLIIALALITAYLGRLKVVTAAPGAAPRGAISRLIIELTYRRRLLEIMLDFILICVAYYLAIWTRLGMAMNNEYLRRYLLTLPPTVIAAYGCLFFFGIYRGFWRYVGMEDLVRFAKAAILGGVLTGLLTQALYPEKNFAPIIYILFAIYLFLGLAATRSSFKILDQVYAPNIRVQEERVLIYGAGDMGEMALRWILMNPQLKLRPVAFLDDDPYKAGKHIHGIEVLGGMDQLLSALQQRQIDGVILAQPAAFSGVPIASEDAIEANLQRDEMLTEYLVESCQKQGCWVRSLRLEFESVEL